MNNRKLPPIIWSSFSIEVLSFLHPKIPVVMDLDQLLRGTISSFVNLYKFKCLMIALLSLLYKTWNFWFERCSFKFPLSPTWFSFYSFTREKKNCPIKKRICCIFITVIIILILFRLLLWFFGSANHKKKYPLFFRLGEVNWKAYPSFRRDRLIFRKIQTFMFVVQ